VLVQSAGITGQTNLKTHEVDENGTFCSCTTLSSSASSFNAVLLADFHKVFSVNSTGMFYCCKAVLPAMLKQVSVQTSANVSSLPKQIDSTSLLRTLICRTMAAL